MNKKNWWLISKESIDTIGNILDWITNTYPEAAELSKGARHELDTGLHLTDEIPGDYKVAIDCCNKYDGVHNQNCVLSSYNGV